jgi:hypothetical protein
MARSRSGSVEKKKRMTRFSISVVSSRDGQRAGRCPVRRRCTGGITFLHIPPDRLRGGLWRCGEGTPEMAKHGKQNKKARNLSVSGPLLKRAWKVCAYAQPPPGIT